jgi:hypothetical protein
MANDSKGLLPPALSSSAAGGPGVGSGAGAGAGEDPQPMDDGDDDPMAFFGDPEAEVQIRQSLLHAEKKVLAGRPVIVAKPRQQVHHLRQTLRVVVGDVPRSTNPKVAVFVTLDHKQSKTIYPYDLIGMTTELIDDAANVPVHGIGNGVIATVDGLSAETLDGIIWIGESSGGQAHDAVSGQEENVRKGFACWLSGLGTLHNNHPSHTFAPFTKFMISSVPIVKTPDGKDDPYRYTACYRQDDQAPRIVPMVMPVHPNPMERIRRLHGPQYRPYMYGFIRSDFAVPNNYDPEAAYRLLTTAALKSHEKAAIPLRQCDAVYLYIALSLLGPSVAPALILRESDDAKTKKKAESSLAAAEDVLSKAAAGTMSMTECVDIIKGIMKSAKELAASLRNEDWRGDSRTKAATVLDYARHYIVGDSATMEAAKIRCKEEITRHANKSIYGTTLEHSPAGGALRYYRR